jgi:hypothetical protein
MQYGQILPEASEVLVRSRHALLVEGRSSLCSLTFQEVASRQPRACTCTQHLSGTGVKRIMVGKHPGALSLRTYGVIGGERERGSRALVVLGTSTQNTRTSAC